LVPNANYIKRGKLDLSPLTHGKRSGEKVYQTEKCSYTHMDDVQTTVDFEDDECVILMPIFPTE
jgi:hypothetical protein